MRNDSLFHLAQGVLLASLLLLAACDPARSVGPIEDPDPDAEVLFQFERTSLSNLSDGRTETAGTFTASGAVEERGSYEGMMSASTDQAAFRSVYGYRRLECTRGTVVMQYTVLFDGDGQHGQIQIKIPLATGVFSGLAGSQLSEIPFEGASPLEAMYSLTVQPGL